jgi:hypothetical protein
MAYTWGKSGKTQTLIHEMKHADQWAIFGASRYMVLYGVAYGATMWRSQCNPFEIWAGLQGGGYDPCF